MRRNSNKSKLKEIFDRTSGHCHFCGDAVIFRKYGMKDIYNLRGVWEMDHIFQKAKGGTKHHSNCLPACYRCNRLRWHRKGKEIRELLFLGILSKKEIIKKTNLGVKIKELKRIREKENIKRRKKINP